MLLKRLYVLFAIEHASRRAHLLGVTDHPGNAFVTQVARDLACDLAEAGHPVKFLIRDRDTKFTASFDEIFRSEGAEVIKAPVRAPRANALAERFVRTVRTECLDWTLVLGRRHLEASCESTSATTTSSGLIAASTSACPSVVPPLRDRRASRSNATTCSVGSSTSTARSRHSP